MDDSITSNLVSVIIPTYNRGYLLKNTIESILAQKYRPLEVLVVDDGSTDDTKAVVSQYRNESVKYLYKDNGGVSSARNFGIQNARGKYVAFLDSDDIWVPWKLTLQIKFLERFSDVGMVWTDMAAVDENGTVLEHRYIRKFFRAYKYLDFGKDFDESGMLGDIWSEAPVDVARSRYYFGTLFSKMMLGNLVFTSSSVIRNSLLQNIGGFDESLSVSGEDYEFHLRTSFHAKIAFLDIPTVDYRIGCGDQLTAADKQVYIAGNNLKTVYKWITMSRHKIDLSERWLREHLAYSHEWLGVELMHAGRQAEASANLWKSVVLSPRQSALAYVWLTLSLLPRCCYKFAYKVKECSEEVSAVIGCWLG